MEALSFDSRRPNPKYLGWITELRTCLSRAMVIASTGRPAGLAFSAGAESELWNQVLFPQVGSAVD
jgi:hypothetical protein